MTYKTKRKQFTLACILAIVISTPLASPTYAQMPGPTQPSAPSQDSAAKKPFTTCLAFTRVKTMTVHTVASTTAQSNLEQSNLQNGNVGSSTDALPDAPANRASQLSIIPNEEMPITEEVTDLITVTVSSEGAVLVEGSGSSAANSKHRAFTYEVNLDKCSFALRYATKSEQDKLDKDEREKISLSGKSKMAKPAAAWTTSSGLKIVTKDPPRVWLAETAARLWWTINNGSVIGASQAGHCYAYNPSSAGTYWYNSYCGLNGPYWSSSQASVSRSANYWNNDFIFCGGGTAYSAHYVAVIGYSSGNWNWQYNSSHWGAQCNNWLSGWIHYY